MIWLSKFRADKIITVSQNTKDDLVEMFNYNPNKIKVIYNGVDSSYKLIDNKKLISEINNKYNTGENFLLYVGNIKPHKNIPVLLKALSNIDKQNKLVIVGKRDKAYDEIFDIIDQNNLKDRIIFTGFVPDEDLILLYNAAALFVYPSLYEGFGLPPLEAMACGTPVITSNVSSLPEVVGDAAITVDPHNIKELSKKINKILSNKDLQNKMIQRGIERAKQFTWDKTARETIKVYEDVLNKKLL
jgi:glycosyltransferase involved in cell wall biosynthesis